MTALSEPDAVDAYGTGRASPLMPGHALVHADLHNHTRLSDGAGDARDAFGSMRAAGLDAAAITDHTNLASSLGRPAGVPVASTMHGLDEHGWKQLQEFAAQADRAGEFVAIRGFEWSHPLLGHVNVWDSPEWTAPVWPTARDLRRFYDWLETPAAGDALTSFNHPGSRGTVLRFGDFVLRPPLGPRMVGLEMFNKTDDYLLAVDSDGVSPLVQCLDAGWRPGLIGVTDEHGRNWGIPEGKGRTGLFVNELSRAGVREALAARRSFATRVKGMRLAATLDGTAMGQRLRRRPAGAGGFDATLVVDLDLGPMGAGLELSVQLLRWAPRVPSVEEVGRYVCGSGLLRTQVRVDPDEPWLVLRVSDPGGRPVHGSPAPYATLGRSIAYASPWWVGLDSASRRPR